MELKQYRGPFSYGDRITVPAQIGYTWVHIGIEIPKRQPITVPETQVIDEKNIIETGQYRPSYENTAILINDQTYQINANDILEFDGLSEIEWKISFLGYLPPETIIDIVWR